MFSKFYILHSERSTLLFQKQKMREEKKNEKTTGTQRFTTPSSEIVGYLRAQGAG